MKPRISGGNLDEISRDIYEDISILTFTTNLDPDFSLLTLSGETHPQVIVRRSVRRTCVFLFTIISPYLWDPYVSPSQSFISLSSRISHFRRMRVEYTNGRKKRRGLEIVQKRPPSVTPIGGSGTPINYICMDAE